MCANGIGLPFVFQQCFLTVKESKMSTFGKLDILLEYSYNMGLVAHYKRSKVLTMHGTLSQCEERVKQFRAENQVVGDGAFVFVFLPEAVHL